MAHSVFAATVSVDMVKALIRETVTSRVQQIVMKYVVVLGETLCTIYSPQVSVRLASRNCPTKKNLIQLEHMFLMPPACFISYNIIFLPKAMNCSGSDYNLFELKMY